VGPNSRDPERTHRYTLSQIFKRDLMTARALGARARHNTEMIVNALRR